MSQQVKIEKALQFVGDANRADNVEGNISFEKVVYYDDFVGKAIDTTNHYTLATVNSGTATVTVPHCLTLTTNAKDDDNTELAMGLEWYGQYNACLEARFRIDDVTNSEINICLTDAQTEGSDDLAIEYETAAATYTAADVAGFFFSATGSVKNIYAGSAKNTAAGATINSLSTATDAKWYTARVELRDNGTTTDALFFCNTDGKEINPVEDLIGIEFDAITRTDPLCPYIGLMNLVDGVACTLDVDYLKVWQDRR